jgi:hypothetical protein
MWHYFQYFSRAHKGELIGKLVLSATSATRFIYSPLLLQEDLSQVIDINDHDLIILCSRYVNTWSAELAK